jgi:outer membrane protein assembly factor BamD (BamD/ComL family)
MGSSVGEVGAKRGWYIRRATPPAATGRGEGTREVFHVLEETEQALAALEAMVDALEARPAKKTQT